MNLALFDFDGTLTAEDSYTAFLYYSSSKLRICLTIIILIPWILGYKFGWVKGTTLRPLLSKAALWRRRVEEIDHIGAEFALKRMPQMLIPSMQEKLKWHKKEGHIVYVISASLEPYMKPFCLSLGVQLICTEIEARNEHYTGRYLHGDCTGENKVKFIKQTIELSEFDTIYAYGDSVEDLPMLALANKAYINGEAI